MSSQWKIKFFIILSLTFFSIYILIPSIFDFQKRIKGTVASTQAEWFSRLFVSAPINLGLDLRGGLYLEMDVDLHEDLKNRFDLLLMELENQFKEKGIEAIVETPDIVDVAKVFLPLTKESEFENIITDYFDDVLDTPENRPSQVIGDQKVIFLKITHEYARHVREMTVKQAEEAVRNRIDRYGVAEAAIQRQGDNRLVVELPGIDDPDRGIDIIRRTGLLEFKMVDDSIERADLIKIVSETREAQKIGEGYAKEMVEKINQALADRIPKDAEVLFELERDPISKQVVNATPLLVKKRAEVTGDMLRNSQVGVADNEPYVSLSFNKIGANNFGQVTKANVGKRMAIVLDGNISTAPVIQSPILNGEAQITLGYGSYQSLLKEAEDLTLLLREGALPASLTIATKTVIGPSLGRDSIRQGLHSLLIASLVIAVFMIFYYRWSGILANVALLFNIIFIFAILSFFRASLTLPGIAGIVLTMGMAVDANIIIFERMREEKRLGKAAKSIVESGYAHAMSAIVDSNLTTLISGIVLFQFGTGPIKGFATTLIIGIVTTMYTAIVVTRVGYDFFVYKKHIKSVSI